MIRYRRERAERYITADGRFRLWREPYRPRRWFINEADSEHGWSDAIPADGFRTLAEAKAYLLELIR